MTEHNELQTDLEALVDDPRFRREPFGERLAFLWLICNAAVKPSFGRTPNGNTVSLDRGELCFSETRLARRWLWNRQKVRRFLKRLSEHGVAEITTRRDNLGKSRSVLLVNGYDAYVSVAEVRP